ncbi:MAG: DUF533 domain-containing protein [Hyphomonadaceae bacterium]|nr:DUF533 domain-containing protein [Hyphomonadaceae bacterium]
MFDARSILDVLVRGGGQPQGQGPGQGADIFRDLLGQLGSQGGLQGGGTPPPSRSPASDPQAMPRGAYRDDPREALPPGQAPDQTGGVSLEDLLRSVLGGGQAGPGSGGGQSGPGGGNLQDLLRDLLGGSPGGSMNRMVGDGGQGGPGQGGGQGGVLDVLKQVLGQATSGVREGAGRLDDMTGASGRAREAIGQATGQSPDELIAKLKELIANNQLGAGAALGGLGALILGTGTGRALAGSAIKLGGLALIGGLAYKAYQNYQQGLPPLTGGTAPTRQGLVAAPQGSGFEPDAVTHESAMLYIRAMIAAAAADGRIDAKEQQKILGGLQQAGMDAVAQQFLTREINHPATAEDLADAVASPQQAVQVYTAARVAVDVDSAAEHAFLSRLAGALGIDDRLAAQIDAAARGAA